MTFSDMPEILEELSSAPPETFTKIAEQLEAAGEDPKLIKAVRDFGEFRFRQWISVPQPSGR